MIVAWGIFALGIFLVMSGLSYGEGFNEMTLGYKVYANGMFYLGCVHILGSAQYIWG